MGTAGSQAGSRAGSRAGSVPGNKEKEDSPAVTCTLKPELLLLNFVLVYTVCMYVLVCVHFFVYVILPVEDLGTGAVGAVARKGHKQHSSASGRPPQSHGAWGMGIGLHGSTAARQHGSTGRAKNPPTCNINIQNLTFKILKH